MPLSAIEAELLILQKFRKNQINLLRNGIRLQGFAGRSLDDLLQDACLARFALARKFLRSAERLSIQRPILHRDIVSRAYYSMYHAARAVSFLTQPGDDFEAHDKVANGLPDDFPDLAVWQNHLKNARLKRNEADYEPYLHVDPAFRTASKSTRKIANDFVECCAKYLRLKGCAV